VDLVFRGVDQGISPMLLMSWFGTLAYTFQIYFDFSGYSDMAIGISLMFGIRLPINFNSPYKATSIIDFWRRWHISLSTFLRDYLYIPLGGSRSGKGRRYLNLMATMLLGGLWHGASWSFVLWGALHGAFLVINQMWRKLIGSDGASAKPGRLAGAAGWLVTFVCVCFAWVLFRSSSVSTAVSIFKGMLGLNGLSLPKRLVPQFRWLEPYMNVQFSEVFQGLPTFDIKPLIGYLALAMLIAFTAPNLNSFSREPHRYWSVYARSPKLAIALGAAGGALFVFCVATLDKVSPFLYFQF
ncbi:MAG: MBOAT family O-acyltransferase, partial [Betaproteobacteria bacterium]